MKALQDCFDLQSILEVLSTFPTGIEALYAATVARIRRLPERQATLALRVLIWIVHAKRPLSVAELQHAIAVSPETYSFEQNRKVRQDFLLSGCCGLVSVEGKTEEVRLIRE